MIRRVLGSVVRCARHDHGNLAADLMGFGPEQELLQRTPENLFIELGHFPGHSSRPVGAESLGERPQHHFQTMRCLKEHHGARLPRQLCEPGLALPGFPRQETFETEAVRRKSRERQRGEYRGGTGSSAHMQSLGNGGFDQPVPGVRYGRHSRVRHHEHVATGAHQIQQFCGSGCLVVLVIADDPSSGCNPEPLEQPMQPTGVLGGNHIRSREQLTQSRRSVSNISNGRSGQGDFSSSCFLLHQPSLVRIQPGSIDPVSQTTTDPSPDGSSAPLAQRVTSIPTAFTEAMLRLRLDGPRATHGLLVWAVPVFAAVVGGLLRFIRLGEPDSLIFDETYYVKDAYSFLISGYEREWLENANESFNAGSLDKLGPGPEYVVHPPVGKWMIAFGMLLFGADNSFGWRFSAAAIGTLSILLVAFAAHKLFRSSALTGIAALLIAVDGHHLVQSRTSLLDIFLMFWVIAAFCALLLDRQQFRRRLASLMAGSIPGQLLYGPWVLWRPWRLAAGVCLGLAIGTKWSGLFYLAAFGLMTVLWDMNARRIAGVRYWVTAGIMRDGLYAFVCMVPVAALTYLGTWTGWLLSDDAYGRRWAQDHPSPVWGWIPDSLRSLAEYHRSAFNFHQGLSSDHSYESTPNTWLFMGRPTSFHYEDPKLGEAGCQVEQCSQAITSVGNPLIWWSAALCLLVLLFYWIGRRDWRAGAILAGVAAGYLPWFMYPERTIFFFYSIVFLPFLILALTYCLGLVLGPANAAPARRTKGVLAVGLFVTAAVAVSAFFLPVWTSQTIPYDMWRLRMWMPSWI